MLTLKKYWGVVLLVVVITAVGLARAVNTYTTNTLQAENAIALDATAPAEAP
jgi:hypothetical protein